MVFLTTQRSFICRLTLPFWLVFALGAAPAWAEALPPTPSGPYADVSVGRAYATFLPLTSTDEDNEHFAAGGNQLSLGFGYGWAFEKLRLDVGGRLQHLRLNVWGNYSENGAYRDDAYRANYDYLSPLFSLSVSSRFASRVNAYAGFGLGTALLTSDRQGKPFRYHALPVYGSLEAGMLVRVAPWLEMRFGVSWVPPVDNLNVLTAQAGLRTEI